MNKLFFIFLLFIVGCGNIENSDGTYSYTNTIRTYVIDSCEYIGMLGFGNCDVFAHKGNCTFCAERRKRELQKVVKELELFDYE